MESTGAGVAGGEAGWLGATQLLEVVGGEGATGDVDSTHGAVVGALRGSITKESSFRYSEWLRKAGSKAKTKGNRDWGTCGEIVMGKPEDNP